MRLNISCIGTIKSGAEADLIKLYTGRIKAVGSNLGFSPFDIHAYDPQKGLLGEKLKSYEAERLLKNYTPQNSLIVLDERGTTPTSREFANMLLTAQNAGHSECRFVIGGADGLSQEIRDNATKIISFGKMTWPHLLVRVMLCEQIYRSLTILSGHPYHRD
jgi:23S rRNA (pseudouridine1915-N3)-methyltransferase